MPHRAGAQARGRGKGAKSLQGGRPAGAAPSFVCLVLMICCAFVHGTMGEHDDDFDRLGHGGGLIHFSPDLRSHPRTLYRSPEAATRRGVYMDGDDAG